MEKRLPEDRRLVLRLWPAYVSLTPNGKQLWIGLVSEQQKVVILNTISFAATAGSEQGAFAQIVLDTTGRLSQRVTETGVLLLRSPEVAPN